MDFPYDILATAGTLVVSNDGTTFYGYARGTYTTDLINLYFAPTEATSTPEVTLKENLQLQSTIITDGILNILTEVKSARIIDTTGRIIMQVENNNSINISAIASGLYIIEATDMNNNSATSRFVKL